MKLPGFPFPGNGLIADAGNIIGQLQQVVPVGILLFYPPAGNRSAPF